MSYLRCVFEELEQIPWSELARTPRRPSPRAIVAVVVVVAASVLLVRARTVPEPLPVEPVAQVPGQAASSAGGEPSPDPVSEADLRAPDESGELLALGTAVVEVRRLSTADHYVEWATAEDVTPLGGGLWSVRVAFQILSTAVPSGPERSAVRRLDVPVLVEGDRAHVAGPMSVSLYQPAPATDAWDLTTEAPSPDLAAVAVAAFGDWADVAITEAGRNGDVWRVMVEADGWPLAVWLRNGDVLPGVPAPDGS